MKFLFRIIKHFLENRQLAKYILVGCVNYAIYTAIFDTLIILTHGLRSDFEFRGIMIYPFVFAGFLAACTNSYFMNRAWTFQASGQRKYKFFFQVSFIGLLINETIAGLLINLVRTPACLPVALQDPAAGPLVAWGIHRIGSASLLANFLWTKISTIMAVIFSTIWNFCAIKFLVFKK